MTKLDPEGTFIEFMNNKYILYDLVEPLEATLKESEEKYELMKNNLDILVQRIHELEGENTNLIQKCSTLESNVKSLNMKCDKYYKLIPPRFRPSQNSRW